MYILLQPLKIKKRNKIWNLNKFDFLNYVYYWKILL